ncbi:hypothetical protein [Mycolicibacter minnesotensis]
MRRRSRGGGWEGEAGGDHGWGHDFVTLTRTVDGAVVEELGRFETYDDARAAAQDRLADHAGQLSRELASVAVVAPPSAVP